MPIKVRLFLKISKTVYMPILVPKSKESNRKPHKNCKICACGAPKNTVFAFPAVPVLPTNSESILIVFRALSRSRKCYKTLFFFKILLLFRGIYAHWKRLFLKFFKTVYMPNGIIIWSLPPVIKLNSDRCLNTEQR